MPSASRTKIITSLRGILRNDQLVLLVLAVIMGVVAAYLAIAFREVYLLIQGLGFGTYSDTLVAAARELPGWQIVLVPTVGGLMIGLFVHYFMPNRRPQSVTDVVAAVAMRSGHMGYREAIGGALVSAASIGVGASVGREGPVVHLGAAVCSRLARALHLNRSLVINLLGCGVAAAIAASFNAPFAGAFFATEVIIGHYALTAVAPIMIASVTGTIIARTHFGDFPAFIIPPNPIVSLLEFPAFALLGIISALMAIVLMHSITVGQDISDKMHQKLSLPRWTHPMLGGALVGLIAIGFPQVLGVGYGTTDAALKELIALPLLLALLAAKTAAVAISLGSGFGGGVFSPSLFLGAMLGGAFGIIATQVFPELSSGHSAYTLVGMAAVAGAVMGAPISTILIIFELTHDNSVTVAVMVAVVIASVVTQQVYGGSFFLKQLDRRGLNIRRGREAGLLAQIHVGDVMTTSAFSQVALDLPINSLREKLQTAPHGQLVVVDEEGIIRGTITLSDLSDAAFDHSIDSLLKAVDVMRKDPPVLTPDTDLDDALELMEGVHEEHIAVVDSKETRKLVGVVNEVEVMLAYNRALMRARAEERGELQ
jgi:CIC family chloride channel protein